MTESSGAEDSAMRRAHIEAMLADYPDIEGEETAMLIRWFRKEASALDVGHLASNPALAEPYRRFKEDHLDRIRGADLMRAFVFVSIVVACLVLIVWRGL